MTRRRVALLAIMCLAAGCGSDAPVGQPFPDMALPRIDAPSERVVAAGVPAIVNFWATWCEPCVREMPDLDRLARRLGPRVRVVGVALERDAHLVREFVLRTSVGFPVYLDADQVLARRLGVDTLPRTLIVDARGVVVDSVSGAQAWDDASMRARIDAALASGATVP